MRASDEVAMETFVISHGALLNFRGKVPIPVQLFQVLFTLLSKQIHVITSDKSLITIFQRPL